VYKRQLQISLSFNFQKRLLFVFFLKNYSARRSVIHRPLCMHVCSVVY